MPKSSMNDRMGEYHEYLSKNYKYGIDRFFAPTGFLKSFERTVTLTAAAKKEAVYAKNMDDAYSKLEPVVAGGEGVYDLVAEPGTGKTTVLPFKFPTKRVVVALPTPFDAWSAYNTASGPAKLKLKGLNLGKAENVCYMDSYMAANMLMSGFMEYDVLIVDECDSGKGVTGFLSDVKAPGKVLIRMSASHGRSGGGPSTSFVVTDNNDLPDVRQGIKPVADFVAKTWKGRSLIMAPDADTAIAIAELVPGARAMTSKTQLGDMSRIMLDKVSTTIVATDEICSRGLNMDLDMVFDCQLVSDNGVVRNLTQAELYQRRNRVGRNRAGHYYSPGLPVMEPKESDADVMRSNVVRVCADVPQCGGEAARVSRREAENLLLSDEDPYIVQARSVAEQVITHRRNSSSSRSSSSAASIRSRSSVQSTRSQQRIARLPAWMMWAATATGKTLDDSNFTVTKKGLTRSSSSSSQEGEVTLKQLMVPARPRSGAQAPKQYDEVAVAAPYAAPPRRATGVVVPVFQAPKSPPVMDLSHSEYEMDWPALLGDLLEKCSDMPTIVPPHGWQHTSVGGIGSNWLQRLETLAVGQLSFSASELELVCRAWNTIVAGTWVKRSPGLSAYAHRDQLEFCLRYYQSYFNLAITG